MNKWIVLVLMVMVSLLCEAQQVQRLQLPAYFSDNMVLPQGRSFSICGSANAKEKVTITLQNEENGKTMFKKQTRAGKDGKWCVQIPALDKSTTYKLTAETPSSSIVLHGILAGELWLASGQSNMAFQLQQSSTAKEDIQAARNNKIRLLDIRPRWETTATTWEKSALDSINALLYYHDARWEACTSETVRQFSAVGYHFARVLQDSLQCPIGIICNAVGGSGEEAWIDRETLERGFGEMLHDWTNNEYIQDWVRGRARLNMGWDAEKTQHNPQQRHPYQPCYLYDSSISMLKDMPISGVIWYQGESNAQDMETHARLFPLLLQSWRKTWNNPQLPFIYTQLSSLNRQTWPEFRNLQRKQLYKSDKQIDNTLGMAVTSDVGDSLDVHPRNKRPVGQRLALWALNNVYGQKCVCSGPLYSHFTTTHDRIEIFFDYADQLTTSDSKPVRTIEYTMDNIQWYSATPHIEGNKLIVCCNQASDVKAVRYGWQPFTRANLVNSQGLPASTFSSVGF